MARGNMVYMMGKIINKPIIKLDKDGTEFISGRFTLLTARRSKLNEKGNLSGVVRSDEQIIISRNPYIIENKIANLEEKDLVIVKGSLSTREVNKKVRCPWCNKINSQSVGVLVYIDPVTIIKIKSLKNEPEEAINRFLIDNAEISNYAMFFGTLVRPPRYAPDFGGNNKETTIQIAINRKRLIVEDGPEKRTDYPYVKAFGQKAEEYARVLHTNSEIYIEGAIQTREVILERSCFEPDCLKDFKVESTAIEIVPYSIEYIDDVDTDILKRMNEEESKGEISEEDISEKETSEEEISEEDYEEDYEEDLEKNEENHEDKSGSGEKTDNINNTSLFDDDDEELNLDDYDEDEEDINFEDFEDFDEDFDSFDEIPDEALQDNNEEDNDDYSGMFDEDE